MTDLEKSMDSMITVFNKYAHDGKHGKALTKKELRKLIEAELPNFLKSQKNSNSVDHIMKDLDQNKDDVLDFEEFMPFIAGLTMACEKYCSMSAKKK
ncbi:protein S100-A10b [Simochromis diagramma]|uniref:protein S100-A10b n=1 Tax=Simochromis diagramma TaxID=43689 RepID=UPI001A7EE280|nr:protein S100-A10b [Simochromis diagramma]XP_039885731.1 protein S100-A10b [Simochromis diagramma]